MGSMCRIDGFSRLALGHLPPGRVTDDIADPYERARAHEPRDSVVDVGGARIGLQQQLRSRHGAIARDVGGDKLVDILSSLRKAAQPLLVRPTAKRLSIAVRLEDD